MRNGKYRIAVIIICFLICILGISYYVKESGREEVNKEDNKIRNTEVIENCSEVKKDEYQQIRGSVDEINDIENILYCCDDNKMLVLRNNKILLEDADRKTLKEVRKVDSSTIITSSEGNNNFVSWIETSELKKGYQILSKNALYLYEIKTGSLKKIDESTYTRNSSDVYCVNHDIGHNLKLKGSRLFYLCYVYDGYRIKDQFIEKYDINSGKKDVLYRQVLKKNNTFLYLYNFDLDYEKNYLACCIKYYGDLKGYALMVSDISKNNNGKLLAVSENEISPTVIYPRMSFQVGNDVHLYNIENKNDDFLYESKNSIKGVKMSGGILAWDADKIYCYNINDKKIDVVEDTQYNGRSSIMGRILYWSSGNGIRYIDLI